ncbi:histone-lysine N-methyltransferase SETMAR [Trichonephila clavipes]|nr:histone-lysine N-methyltransferase SETMAR [Trichonephila clavipes]
MATSRNDTLKHHLSNLPTENSEVCQVYNKDFNHRSNLNSHLRIHIQKNPHVCKICNKVFSRSDNLKIHLRIHTVENNHVREVSNKAFSQSGNLKKTFTYPYSGKALGENASQAAEIVKGLYGADIVIANYVQFWFHRFRSGIFHVKEAPRTFRTVVENVDKITEIIEVDWHVSSRSIAQELKIDHKTVLNHLHKVGFKKMLDLLVLCLNSVLSVSDFTVSFALPIITGALSETQNNKKSINSLIWTFVPKHLLSGPKIFEIATFLYVIIFNEDFVGVLKVMTTMGCPVGREAHTYVRKRDETRSERRTSDAIKQESIDTRAEQFVLKEYQEEGVLYGPGISE